MSLIYEYQMPKTYKVGINDKRRDEMIKFFEESGRFSPKAYLDTEDLPTIGWGNRFHADGREVRMGDTITKEEADKLYNQEVTKHVAALRATKNYSMFNPNQQAALESFAYNAGPNFLSSDGWRTISAAIKSGDAAGVAKALPMYNNGGVLRNRRAQELEEFNKPYTEPTPARSELTVPTSSPSDRNKLTIPQKQSSNPLQNLMINAGSLLKKFSF
tara:strand:+ start:948 stop:1595 length:648 start_codon:yes stop_codon:yes gene_type:complete